MQGIKITFNNILDISNVTSNIFITNYVVFAAQKEVKTKLNSNLKSCRTRILVHLYNYCLTNKQLQNQKYKNQTQNTAKLQ